MTDLQPLQPLPAGEKGKIMVRGSGNREHMAPREVRAVAALPATGTGKVLRRLLRGAD